jgi:predicted nucleic acid-binding protein
VILDTTALIALERRRGQVESLSADDDVAIGAITLAELRHGALGADRARRGERESFIVDVMASIDILPYTSATAGEHAVLLAHVRRAGRPRGAHDLIIAAHARESGRRVVSSDVKARFGDLPGVIVEATS